MFLLVCNILLRIKLLLFVAGHISLTITTFRTLTIPLFLYLCSPTDVDALFLGAAARPRGRCAAGHRKTAGRTSRTTASYRRRGRGSGAAPTRGWRRRLRPLVREAALRRLGGSSPTAGAVRGPGRPAGGSSRTAEPALLIMC